MTDPTKSAPDDALESIRSRYLEVDTANVADVLETMGLPDQAAAVEFAPYPQSTAKLAGWAYTLRGQMAPYEPGEKDPEKMAALAAAPAGSVTVWAGGGVGVCCFGELITIGMKERGCVGALVDGGVRDQRWIAPLDFPVFARYRSPVQSIGRWRVTGSQVPVSLPGATSAAVPVHPGDFVLGDEDGVMIIPQAKVEKVLEGAEALGRQEVEIREALATGMSLPEALSRFGAV